MGGDDSGVESDNFDWNTDDELEIENFQFSSLCLTVPNGVAITGSAEATSSAGPSSPKLFDRFVGMGFSGEMVCKVIQEHGEQNEEKLLEELLTFSASSCASPSSSKLFDQFVAMGFPGEMDCKVIQEHGDENEDKLHEEILTCSASSSAGPSSPKLFDRFVGMGFPGEMVCKVIQEHGEENEEKLLEELLTFSASSSASPSSSKLFDQFVAMGFPGEMDCKVIQEHGDENEDKLLEELLTYLASSSAGPSSPKLFDRFVGMGFPGEMVCKVIQEHGEENEEKLLEELLTFSASSSASPSSSKLFDQFVAMGFPGEIDCKVIQEHGDENEHKLLEELLTYSASSFASPSSSKLFDQFVGMGFPGEIVCKVIQEHGDENEHKLLEELLTYSVRESSQPQPKIELVPCFSDCPVSSLNDSSDTDTFSDDECNLLGWFLQSDILPLPRTLVEDVVQPPTSLPDGVKFEMHTLPVDAKAVADGDTVTVYVSTADSRESSFVPGNVHTAAVQRTEARARRDYANADAFHQQIIDSGYRVIRFQNEEILARKYRIRLRGIDAPESSMPYGEEAKIELTKAVQGKSLRVLVYGEDRYGRSVGDIYCNGIFVQELMLKMGLAWHYTAYDERPEFETWEKEARARRVGLWASENPEKPWEWRKDRREAK